MTKEEKKEEMKNRISMALKDPILQQGFEIICKNLTEQEEKIADIKANCDYVLEGKEVEYREERKKLCEDFENMKAGLESKIAELEQQLDFVREERNKFQEKCEDIELNYYCDRKGGCKVQELEQQIEKMKCCEMCKYKNLDWGFSPICEARDKIKIENPWTCKCDTL